VGVLRPGATPASQADRLSPLAVSRRSAPVAQEFSSQGAFEQSVELADINQLGSNPRSLFTSGVRAELAMGSEGAELETCGC